MRTYTTRHPWLTLVVLPASLLVFGLQIGLIIGLRTPINSITQPIPKVVTPTPASTSLPKKTPPPTTPTVTPKASFPQVCPKSGWVDCMPVLDQVATQFCTPEYLRWAKANCADFQGAAY